MGFFMRFLFHICFQYVFDLLFTGFLFVFLQPLTCEVLQSDGSKVNFPLNQSFNQTQIEWFKAGSALNKMAQK